MSQCVLCPRRCGVDRKIKSGFCGAGDVIKIAKASLHYWEEPCLSGLNGSGTIFFSGCSLGCVFCQNSKLSHDNYGVEISEERFVEILFELQKKGAHNINLVTADHYLHKIISPLKYAKNNGLFIPVFLNTSSYIKSDLIYSLNGVIDGYIADLKYFRSETAVKYSKAPDYPQIAFDAIESMYTVVGKPVYENGLVKSGLIVRILVLPNNLIDAKLSIKYILDKYGDNVCLSIMNQFTPIENRNYPELERKLSDYEYKSVVEFALKHNFSHGYIQQKESADKKYIPDFNLEGVL